MNDMVSQENVQTMMRKKLPKFVCATLYTNLQLLEVVNTSILPHENDNIVWMPQI